MNGHMKLISTLIISFSVFFLSGCGDDGTATANSVMDAIKNEEFHTAKAIYEDAIEETDNSYEVDEAVSKAILDYLDECYEVVSKDSRREAGFYYLLSNIEEMRIDNDELIDEVLSYKAILEDSDGYVEGDTNIEVNSFNEDAYVDEEDDSNNDEEIDYGEGKIFKGDEDNPYSATSIDHDCSDFDSQEDAQLFYEANGGPEYDPHDLDRDNDGMACDWN